MTFKEWFKNKYGHIPILSSASAPIPLVDAFNAGRKAFAEEAAEIASNTLETDNPRLGDCYYGEKAALAILKRAGEIG